MLRDVAIVGDGNVIKREAENFLKYTDLTIETRRMWNLKNNGDTSNSKGNWNHLKIIQKILQQRSGKRRNQGTKRGGGKSYWHCKRTSVIINPNVQNI